jgi:uncharacterized membrane protein
MRVRSLWQNVSEESRLCPIRELLRFTNKEEENMGDTDPTTGLSKLSTQSTNVSRTTGDFFMAKKNNVVIAYFPSADEADAAASKLKAWDKDDKDLKLGGIGILTSKDGKLKTRKVGTRDTGKGAGWGTVLGATIGVLSGGVTLIGGALIGATAGAATGALFHKGLGLSDDDKASLEKKLGDSGAAVVTMAGDDDVEAAQAELSSEGGEVENYKVSDDSAAKLEEATDVPAPDESDDEEAADDEAADSA